MKKICRVAIDVANNNSAIATVLYEVSDDGKTRKRIPGTARLWNDTGAKQINSCLIPSVILYQEENQGMIDKDCYGHDALATMKKVDTGLKVCGNIKYRFFVEEKSYGKNAKDFGNLVAYLLNCIQFKEGTEPDAYELWVSHPVICDKENLFQLEDIIGDALSNYPKQIEKIQFVNEAECAFRFALSDEKVKNTVYEALKTKEKAIGLVCDIGGSTMELSLYQFIRKDRNVSYTCKGILRADDEEGRAMGSYKMDKTLRNKLKAIGVLEQKKLGEIAEDLSMLRWFAPLKEDLNNRLRIGQQGRLDSLHAIAIPQKLMQYGTVSKKQFEEWCEGYTASICKQIQKLAKKEGIHLGEIDFAILTGGGCELYPIENAIQTLLKTHNKKASVLRPNNPRKILDGKIADAEHPDYVNGLYTKDEIASLACVLGNLAEEIKLTMPKDFSIGISTGGTGNGGKTPIIDGPVITPVKENKYERKFSSFRPCPDDGFIAFWFKSCETKGYSCNSYCKCDRVCTEYSCDSDCGCDSHCSDYDYFLEGCRVDW